MQSKRKPGLSVEQIARIAERDNDVSRFFTNTGKTMNTDSTGQCRFRAETGLRQQKLKRDKCVRCKPLQVGRYHSRSF